MSNFFLHEITVSTSNNIARRNLVTGRIEFVVSCAITCFRFPLRSVGGIPNPGDSNGESLLDEQIPFSVESKIPPR
jgi:hypothetical protein